MSQIRQVPVPDDDVCRGQPDGQQAFYNGGREITLATTVTYEDGRQGTIQSRVRIEDVDGAPPPATAGVAAAMLSGRG